MRIQIVKEKNEVIEINDVKYIICEDNSGGRYTVYPKEHSLVITQPESSNQIPMTHEVRMITENDRRSIIGGIRNIKELLNKLEELV